MIISYHRNLLKFRKEYSYENFLHEILQKTEIHLKNILPKIFVNEN